MEKGIVRILYEYFYCALSRLAYPVYLLEKLKEGNQSLLLLYDIACLLEAHLKVVKAIAIIMLYVYLPMNIAEPRKNRLAAPDKLWCSNLPCICPWCFLSGSGMNNMFLLL